MHLSHDIFWALAGIAITAAICAVAAPVGVWLASTEGIQIKVLWAWLLGVLMGIALGVFLTPTAHADDNSYEGDRAPSTVETVQPLEAARIE